MQTAQRPSRTTSLLSMASHQNGVVASGVNTRGADETDEKLPRIQHTLD